MRDEATDCDGGAGRPRMWPNPKEEVDDGTNPKSGVLRPPHQSAACSKMRPQIVKVGPVPRNLETSDHHTSQLHEARWAGRPQKPGDTSQLQQISPTRVLSTRGCYHGDVVNKLKNKTK
ncbi:uncharacterized protein ACJ7VT_019683 isoform 1-T4 [Polymixia lowei]